MRIVGRCHCGNFTYELQTRRPWEEITLRVCRCEFCLRHRPRYWSDPEGTIRVRVKDPADIVLYRFGHRTADFTLCRRCGVFCLAVTRIGGLHRAVANLNLTLGRDDRPKEAFIEALEEKEDERRSRRAANWTPLLSPWPPGQPA